MAHETDHPGADQRYGGGRGYPDEGREMKKRSRNDSYYGPSSRERSGSYYGRGDDDCYGGRKYDDDWKCLECKTRNYPEEDRCARCGANKPRRRSDMRDDRRPDFRKALDRFDKDADEFGRAKKKKKEVISKQWPSIFSESGASYVFDARSGFFYEAASDFFYDPKTKLYYGNKKKLYYQHVAGQDPPFCEVANQPEVTTTSESDVLLDTSGKNTGNKTCEKKMIAISLKTKTLGKGKKKPVTAAKPSKEDTTTDLPGPPTLMQKKHAAHMDMWSERGKEMRGDEKKPDSSKVAKTTKGQPVCLLCRRKFASVEKLRQHEKVSALHKENLAKKEAAEKESATVAQAPEYRDRAKERRVMYGPETTAGMVPGGNAAVEEPRPAEVVKPEESLGESNIGNQMLQKLGWKSGASLGRKSQEATQQDLRKDWQKIESLAEGSRGGTSGGGGIGS